MLRASRLVSTRSSRETVVSKGVRSIVACAVMGMEVNDISPRRNAATAISFAALRMQGILPPHPYGVESESEHWEFVVIRGFESEVGVVGQTQGRRR